MNTNTLALYGVTGDLAAKMLLPALAKLMQRDDLRLRVIGIGHKPLDASQVLAASRKRSLEETPELAPGFDALAASFSYIFGDLADDAVYRQLADKLHGAHCPLHYLAIPPSLFEPVVTQLARHGLATDARLAIEKPFGHDLTSARDLEKLLDGAFSDPRAVFRIDHFLGKHSIRNLSGMRARSPVLREIWSKRTVRSVQVTMAETFGIEQRGAFYESVGAIRDVFQNHLLQLLAVLAMEPVPPADRSGFAAARIDAIESMRPLTAADVVLGQYDSYQREPHVSPTSRTHTFIAARVHVESARFAGVPFLVRAGKRMAVTATTAALTVRAPDESSPHSGEDHLRFRLGPGDAWIRLDSEQVMSADPASCAPLSLAAELPPDSDQDAYVNVLAAVLAGDHSVSEQAPGVEAAWRVVQEVLDADLPVHPYARGSWGPQAADRLLPDGCRWWNASS